MSEPLIAFPEDDDRPLTDEAIESVFSLVFSSHPEVNESAALFALVIRDNTRPGPRQRVVLNALVGVVTGTVVAS